MGNYSSYRQVGPDVVEFTLGDGKRITGQFTQQFGRWLDGFVRQSNDTITVTESTIGTFRASYGGVDPAATFASYSAPAAQTIQATYGSDRVRPVSASYSNPSATTTFARYS